MAQIHGTSGSTKYLLDKMRPINGKKLTSLEEIQYFYSHYKEILAETESIAARPHEEKILALGDEESRLDKELQEGITWRTIEVDTEIDNLDQKITMAAGFFAKTGCRVRYWVAVALRNHHIHSPFRNLSIDLKNVQNQKVQHIRKKQNAIEWGRNNVASSYQFLKSNESFLIGADGEEVVINALSRLPDEYHVLNDVNIRFDRALHWKERDHWIRSCQIDHIVAGPTGIFLLETKNWKRSDIGLKSDKLKLQVRRSSVALWYCMQNLYWMDDRPKVWNVVISLKGSSSSRKLDKFIDIVSPRHLCDYITKREPSLSKGSIDKFVDHFSR